MRSSNLVYVPGWLDQAASTKLFDAALSMGLKQYDITVWEKTFPQPRLTAWCSDDGKGYRYSNQITPAVPWPEELLKCRQKLEEEYGESLPTCLVNMYRDGKDSVGWHKDDESIFGSNPAIFTVSLGDTRRFMLKNPETKDTKKFDLANGDLLLFSGEYTNKWVHTLAKTGKPVGIRISLTYRTID